MHGEPFPDASIVAPFGCAALILLDKEDRGKFKATCAMLIFVHYALNHPLYTYAFFSPRTKRIVYRQDCIFLPDVFPMRSARAAGGFDPEGEALITHRPRSCYGKKNKEGDSLDDWKEGSALPAYEDHITGHTLVSPPDNTSLRQYIKAICFFVLVFYLVEQTSETI